MPLLPARALAFTVSIVLQPLVLTAVRAQAPEPASIRCVGSLIYDTDASRNCVAIAAGGSGLAMHQDGSLAAWGDTSLTLLAPPPQLPPGMSWLDFVSGYGSALALRSDGTLVHWGTNNFGEGNVPSAPPGLHFVKLARSSSYHRGAVLSDGTLVEWGAPYVGGATAPPLPAGLTWQKVDLGPRHGLGLRSDGSVVAWGSNVLGESNVPPPPPGRVYADVGATGDMSSVALLSDGSFVYWGNPSNHSALPTGTFTRLSASSSMYMFVVLLRANSEVVVFGTYVYPGSVSTPGPAPLLPAGVSYVDVAAGTSDYGYVLALRSDGRVVGWGTDGRAECDGPGRFPDDDFVQVTASAPSWCCGLTRDGNVRSWGSHSQPRYAPFFDAPPLPAGVVYTHLAAGYEHALARRSDGQVVAFGLRNTNGQNNVPPPPPGISYVGVGAGRYHSLALRSDGGLTGFGYNLQGQCNAPALPPGLRYVAVDGSEWCSIALRSDGRLIAFGDTTSFGQGQVPPLPPGLVWRSISLGEYHAVALRSDGALVAWGNNSAGQCNVPPLPPGVVWVEAVAAHAGGHTVARRSDGVVVAFGNNSAGQSAIPAPPAGRGFVGFDAGSSATVLRAVAPSSYVIIAPGCGPTASRLIPHDTPRLDADLRVDVTDLPHDLAILCTGFDLVNSSLGPLPVDLAAFDVPGCLLQTSLDQLDLLVGSGGRAEWSIHVPYQPAFLGMQFRQQAIVFDAAMANALQVRMSEAAAGVVGG